MNNQPCPDCPRGIKCAKVNGGVCNCKECRVHGNPEMPLNKKEENSKIKLFPLERVMESFKKLQNLEDEDYKLWKKAFSEYKNWKVIEIPLTELESAYPNFRKMHVKVESHRLDNILKYQHELPPIILCPITASIKHVYKIPISMLPFKYMIADGWHRTLAYKKQGKKTIRALVPA